MLNTMKYLLSIVFLCLSLFVVPHHCFAIVMTEQTINNIMKSYGFIFGQQYSLDKISEIYPSLAHEAKKAELEFYSVFNSSSTNLEKIMSDNFPKEWEKAKIQLYNEYIQLVDLDNMSYSMAEDFIKQVKDRAKGQIESPFLEILVGLKDNYLNYPHLEFSSGYKKKYIPSTLNKSKGVNFSIEYPITWTASEAERPNIVQKFAPEFALYKNVEFMVMVLENPEFTEENLKEEMSLILKNKDYAYFVDDNAKFIEGGKYVIEGLDGIWARSEQYLERGKNSSIIESVVYSTFYKDKIIMMTGQVHLSFNDKKNEGAEFEKYEDLFDLIANSFIILDLYK